MAFWDFLRTKEGKLRKEIERKELEARSLEAELMSKRLSYVNDEIDLLENRRIVKDEAQGWIVHGQGYSGEKLTEQEVSDVQTEAYKMYKTNPHARAIIRAFEKFIMGKGTYVDHRDDRSEVREVWDRFERENNWGVKQKEIVRRAIRDGEVFIYKKTGLDEDRKPIIQIRFIEPFEIGSDSTGKPSYGIETAGDDVEDVVYYNKLDKSSGELKPTKIDADDIIHIKLNSDSNDKRGVPVIEPVMAYIAKYEGWLNDRIVLNKVRTAIALVKKYDATPEKISNLRNENRSNRTKTTGLGKKQRAYEPGTIIHTTKGVEYEFITPDVDARDVAEDGRAILLAIASGSGLPEYIVTADSSNANYSSTLVAESPAVREIEDYQSTFGLYFRVLYRDVMEDAMKRGNLQPVVGEKEGITLTTKAEFIFPSLIHRDFLEENQAYAIMHEHGILSKKTWAENADLNYDNEKQNFGDEGGPTIPSQSGKADKFNKGDREKPPEDGTSGDPDQKFKGGSS